MTTYRTDTVPPILFENVQQALSGTSHRRMLSTVLGWLTSYGRQKEDFASLDYIFNSVICSHKIGLAYCQDVAPSRHRDDENGCFFEWLVQAPTFKDLLRDFRDQFKPIVSTFFKRCVAQNYLLFEFLEEYLDDEDTPELALVFLQTFTIVRHEAVSSSRAPIRFPVEAHRAFDIFPYHLFMRKEFVRAFNESSTHCFSKLTEHCPYFAKKIVDFMTKGEETNLGSSAPRTWLQQAYPESAFMIVYTVDTYTQSYIIASGSLAFPQERARERRILIDRLIAIFAANYEFQGGKRKIQEYHVTCSYAMAVLDIEIYLKAPTISGMPSYENNTMSPEEYRTQRKRDFQSMRNGLLKLKAACGTMKTDAINQILRNAPALVEVVLSIFNLECSWKKLTKIFLMTDEEFDKYQDARKEKYPDYFFTHKDALAWSFWWRLHDSSRPTHLDLLETFFTPSALCLFEATQSKKSDEAARKVTREFCAFWADFLNQESKVLSILFRFRRPDLMHKYDPVRGFARRHRRHMYHVLLGDHLNGCYAPVEEWNALSFEAQLANPIDDVYKVLPDAFTMLPRWWLNNQTFLREWCKQDVRAFRYLLMYHNAFVEQQGGILTNCANFKITQGDTSIVDEARFHDLVGIGHTGNTALPSHLRDEHGLRAMCGYSRTGPLERPRVFGWHFVIDNDTPTAARDRIPTLEEHATLLEPHFHDGSAVLTQSPILETLFDPSLFDWDSGAMPQFDDALCEPVKPRSPYFGAPNILRGLMCAYAMYYFRTDVEKCKRVLRAAEFFSEERFYLASSDSASFSFSDGGFDRGVNMSGGLLAHLPADLGNALCQDRAFVEELLKKLPGELMRLPTKELREDATLIPIVLRSNPLLASCFSITQLMQNQDTYDELMNATAMFREIFRRLPEDSKTYPKLCIKIIENENLSANARRDFYTHDVPAMTKLDPDLKRAVGCRFGNGILGGAHRIDDAFERKLVAIVYDVRSTNTWTDRGMNKNAYLRSLLCDLQHAFVPHGCIKKGSGPTYIDTTVDWAFDFGDMQLFGEYQAPMGKPIDAAIVGLITDANDTSVLDKIKFERHIYLRKAYHFLNLTVDLVAKILEPRLQSNQSYPANSYCEKFEGRPIAFGTKGAEDQPPRLYFLSGKVAVSCPPHWNEALRNVKRLGVLSGILFAGMGQKDRLRKLRDGAQHPDDWNDIKIKVYHTTLAHDDDDFDTQRPPYARRGQHSRDAFIQYWPPDAAERMPFCELVHSVTFSRNHAQPSDEAAILNLHRESRNRGGAGVAFRDIDSPNQFKMMDAVGVNMYASKIVDFCTKVPLHILELYNLQFGAMNGKEAWDELDAEDTDVVFPDIESIVEGFDKKMKELSKKVKEPPASKSGKAKVPAKRAKMIAPVQRPVFADSSDSE